MPEWTLAQQNAINANGCNILVSAAAGSGKTAVLVQRVIRLITDDSLDVNIDQLLIVTFTNAAAAEMRERIAKELDEIIEKEPNNTNVLKQRSLLPNAKISTIDSFCINLVREYFFRLDISQDFKIIDNAQLALIEENAVNDVIESCYEENDEDFKGLVELLSNTKSDSDLISTIKQIDRFIVAQPFPLVWLNHLAELYNPEIGIDSSRIKEYVVKRFNEALKSAYETLDELCSLLSLIDKNDKLYSKYEAFFNKDRECLNAYKTSLLKSWDEIRETVKSVKFPSIPTTDSVIKEIIRSKRTLYATGSNVIKSKIIPLLAFSADEFKEDNETLYPLIKKLVSVIEKYHNRCFEYKKELNAYTFSDIEHFAINLLFSVNEDGSVIKSDIAREYERNFYEVLVDEYQDTNSAQDTLFEMLSNGKNRFMVGDVKQSIYRFRLAMPQIFNSKKDKFSHYDEASNEVNQKIILDKNFRSCKGICDYVNFVFSNIMSNRVGEIDYNDEEALVHGGKDNDIPFDSVTLNIVDCPTDEDRVEYEARQVAKYIVDCVNSGELVRDGDNGFRPAQYSDFAVLLRNANVVIDTYSKVFTDFGIPVTANNKSNLFENKEVAILISLLKVVDNPTLDIPLLATLMSLFYGYTPEAIAKARINKRTGNLYSAIAAEGDTFSEFINDIKRFKEYASSMSVENFIRLVISETSYLSLISVLGNAEQRRLNVLKFISVAKIFDSGESVGLTAFLRFLDNIIENNVSYDSAEFSGFENSVQIMSIHKSKGLEFPICILADTSHQYNDSETKSLVLLNDDLGAGFKVLNEKYLYRYKSLQFNTIADMHSYQNMSEILRVLYVAITRAKDRFVSFVSLKDAEKKIKSCSGKLCNGKIYPDNVIGIRDDGSLLLLTAMIHPDGEILRSICGNSFKSSDGNNSHIKVNILTENSVAEHAEQQVVNYNDDLLAEIEAELKFEYDYSELSHYSSKRNASELDDKEQSFRFFASKQPSFISDNVLTGAEKGTAMHAFMQYCDYSKAVNDVEAEIERIKDNGFISEIQASSLNRAKLKSFVSSDIAKRIINADKVYRELKLASFVPVSETENSKLDEEILVQGVADLVFEENGKLVLLDFKTDYVKNEDELLTLYKNQLKFYKYAVEKTLEKKVNEYMLYSFSLDKCCIYK